MRSKRLMWQLAASFLCLAALSCQPRANQTDHATITVGIAQLDESDRVDGCGCFLRNQADQVVFWEDDPTKGAWFNVAKDGDHLFSPVSRNAHPGFSGSTRAATKFVTRYTLADTAITVRYTITRSCEGAEGCETANIEGHVVVERGEQTTTTAVTGSCGC